MISLNIFIKKMTKQQIKLELSMEDINARIKKEICYKTLEQLTDLKLIVYFFF